MEIVYLLVPLSLCLSIFGLYAFFWAIKDGQYDDTDTPQIRMLFDDKENPKSENSKKS